MQPMNSCKLFEVEESNSECGRIFYKCDKATNKDAGKVQQEVMCDEVKTGFCYLGDRIPVEDVKPQ